MAFWSSAREFGWGSSPPDVFKPTAHEYLTSWCLLCTADFSLGGPSVVSPAVVSPAPALVVVAVQADDQEPPMLGASTSLSA